MIQVNANSLIGFLAGTICTISFLPQVIRILRTKNTKDLSLPTFLLFSLGISIWLIYGLLIKDMPVIAANAVTLILALTIVFLKMKHG